VTCITLMIFPISLQLQICNNGYIQKVLDVMWSTKAEHGTLSFKMTSSCWKKYKEWQ